MECADKREERGAIYIAGTEIQVAEVSKAAFGW